MIAIEWTDTAIRDIANLHEYITRDSLRFFDGFVSRNQRVREIIHRNYRIVCRFESRRPIILMVVQAGRDLQNLKAWEVS